MSKIDMIIERLKAAPPEVLDEVYALMEKIGTSKPTPPAEPKRGILDLIGTLKDSKTFEGDPVEIQRRLRDEWN